MDSGSKTPLTFRDLIVAVVLSAVIPVAGLQLTSPWREQATRMRCANNLRQIGAAIQLYANGNRGAFPRTVFGRGGNPVPTEYTGRWAADPFASDGPLPNDVTAGLYLLLREGLMEPAAVVCPNDDLAAPWNFDRKTARDFSNLPSRSFLSYGYCNAYPSAAALASNRIGVCVYGGPSSGDFAIAADIGPRPSSLGVPANATPIEMAKANSPNHGGAGQNVLYADMHLEWSNSVYCGSPRPIHNAPRDNIYAFGIDDGKPNSNAHGAPQDLYDSILLPTADLGPQPSAATRARRAARGMAVPAALFVLPVGVAMAALGLAVRRGRRGAARMMSACPSAPLPS